MEYPELKREILSDQKLWKFIQTSLRVSLKKLGYSTALIDDLLVSLLILDIQKFIGKHDDELERIQIRHFLGKLAPKLFEQYVLPEIPQNGKVLDLGCGRGMLIELLKNRGTNKDIIGIDIVSSPTWEGLQTPDVHLKVIKEEYFNEFVKQEAPDIVVATWSLHHMTYKEQENYLKSLRDILCTDAVMVILEDSYATTIQPETGQEIYEAFMSLDITDRFKSMGALDWIANRILSKRTKMPVPCAYRTLEEWEKFLDQTGFKTTKTRFLGFPDNRDVNNPQSILVAKRI